MFTKCSLSCAELLDQSLLPSKLIHVISAQTDFLIVLSTHVDLGKDVFIANRVPKRISIVVGHIKHRGLNPRRIGTK